MKYLIIVVMVLSMINGHTQVVSNVVDKVKIGIKIGIEGEVIQRIDKDTVHWVRLHYQNLHYYYTVDRASIGIWDQETLIDFKKCITETLKYTDTKTQNVRFDKRTFSVYVYDSSKYIYFANKKGKYTRINKKQTIKFLDWLNTITVFDE